MKAGIPGVLIPPARRPMRLGYRLLLTTQLASITPQATPGPSRWTACASSTWSPGDCDAASPTIRRPPPPAGHGTTGLTERVGRLEGQMAAVTEALEVLTRGLESSSMAEPPDRHIEEAARRAHELLLLAKSTALGTGRAEGETST